jgi:hypothetical protein
MPRVLRRGRRSSLPLLLQFIREPRQLREAGEQLIPVASIVGSVDGASQLFDRNFRPVSGRARARLGNVLVAMRKSEPLPPIEVWAWRGEHYVLDGHHRVAAARALGSNYMSPHVVEVVELSRYDHGSLTVGVRRRTRTEPSAAPEIAHSVLRAGRIRRVFGRPAAELARALI